MRKRWTVTDDITDQSVTDDIEGLRRILPGWFPQGPPEVLDAVTTLLDTLAADSGPIDGLESYLAVTVEPA